MTQTSAPAEICLSFVRTGESAETTFSEDRPQCGAGQAALGIGTKPLLAHIPAHNFDRYDFGSEPPIAEPLYQGPLGAALLRLKL